MSSKIEKARSILARHGLGGLCLHILRIVFRHGRNDNVRRIFLFELSASDATKRSFPEAEGHTFRFATREDIERYHADPAWNIRDRDVEAFENGARCLLQLDGETLVGFAWLAASQLVEIMWGFHFNMPDDTAYNYHSYTAPAYRGKGFQALRHLKLFEHIKANGQHRLFGYVHQMNLNSLRGVRKSGYTKIGVLQCTKKANGMQFSLRVSSGHWSLKQRT